MCNKKCGVGNRDYYKSVDGDIEAIDIIEMYGLGFSLGNAIKYILRAGKKGDIGEDLVKAIWYINRHMDCVNDMGVTKVNAPAKKESTLEMIVRENRKGSRGERPKIMIFEECAYTSKDLDDIYNKCMDHAKWVCVRVNQAKGEELSDNIDIVMGLNESISIKIRVLKYVLDEAYKNYDIWRAEMDVIHGEIFNSQQIHNKAGNSYKVCAVCDVDIRHITYPNFDGNIVITNKYGSPEMIRYTRNDCNSQKETGSDMDIDMS